MPSRTDLTGEVFGLLTVVERLEDGRSPSGYPYSRYRCVCSCGEETVVRGTALPRANTQSCGCLALAHTVAMGHANIKPTVTYRSAHGRLYAWRGSPTQHACVDCGGTSKHWSLRHSAQVDGTDERGRPFSGDPAAYDPRCVPCHKRYDLAHAETPGAAGSQRLSQGVR